MGSETFERLKNILGEYLLGDSNFKPETEITDIEEWDSIMHITLIAAIEKEFKVKFNLHELVNIENLAQLASLIDGKKSK